MTGKKQDHTTDNAFKDSASQIWQAGLGAFAKAQEEGSKVFEALVREGQAIQRKTQATTEEKMAEATERMAAMAGDLSSRAQGQWGELETAWPRGMQKPMPHAVLTQLLVVQDRDARRRQLEQQLAAVPGDRARVEKEIAAEKAAIEAAKQELRELETKKKLLETEIGSAETKLAKYRTQQLSVKKNDEYQALGKDSDIDGGGGRRARPRRGTAPAGGGAPAPPRPAIRVARDRYRVPRRARPAHGRACRRRRRPA